MNPTRLFALLLLAVGTHAVAPADPPPAKPSDEPVRAFLAQHCAGCHGGEKPKRDFRVDRLASDFADKANRERWAAVLGHLKDGTMPPDTKPRPPEKDVKAAIVWIAKQVEAGEAAARATQGRTVLRRLNRIEYENTIRDLLGIDVELQEMLPADTSANGFDNSGDALHTSSFLMEKYLEAADISLTKAIANNPQPALIKSGIL